MSRPKVAVLVAAHCEPKVLKMTLGSWLECHDGSYDAKAYVGLHRNYRDCCPSGEAEMMAMDGKVGLTLVDEVDWTIRPDKPYEAMLRYSAMHARSLSAMLARARKEMPDMTHVAVLDHDLVFRSDFVGWALKRNADVVASLFEDRDVDAMVDMLIGGRLPWAPKVSAWHMVMSRRMADCLARWPFLAEPCVRHGRAYDTMSLAFEFAKRWGMRMCVPKGAELDGMVRHLWSMSLNYGPMQDRDGGQYAGKARMLSEEYDRRFPEGIDGLWERAGRA